MTEKTNPLFEQALANVNPETRAEVRGNMEFIDKACEIVRDLANEYFGDWEQSCKFDDKFREAMGKETQEQQDRRLAHADSLPKELVELETEFTDWWLKDHDFTPAFADAIGWARDKQRAELTWHKASEELPPVDTEVVCKMKGVPHIEHFVCKWDGKYWWHWGWLNPDAQGWFGLNEGWEVVEWKEI